ncbi:ankyrin repeat domain-containing protein, partial [Aspergillus ruber CBS 135680]
IRMLFENGANIKSRDKYGQAPLLHAMHNRREGTTDMLLKYGAGPQLKDDNGPNLLSRAAEYGRIAIFHRLLNLLRRRADANLPDSHGRTPFMWAALEGHEEVTRLLLSGVN